jgi:hypothetical protein
MDGFTVATNVMGKNTGADFSEGLQVLCNNFGQESMLNAFDIALTDFEMDYTDNEPTMAATQGMMPSNTQDVTAPAGNLFSYNPGNGAYDYYAEPDANSVIYFHHTPDGVFNVVPQTIEGELLPFGPVGEVFYSPLNSCPSEINYVINVPSLISKMTLLDGLIEDEWNVYEERVDMGSTTNLVAFITNPAHSSIEVRNELMLYPKDISDDAWKAAVYRIPAMNPWHLAQALIAGSPLRPEVIHLMEDAGIDQYYIDLVKNNQSGGITQKMILESEITHFQGERQHTADHLLRGHLVNDSLVSWTDVSGLFDGVDHGLRAYLKADFLANQGDYESSETTLGACVVDGEVDVWCELLKEIHALDRDSLDWHALSGDLLQLSLHLASHPELRGSATSRALLVYSDTLQFDAEIAYPQSAKGLRVGADRKHKLATLQAFPNPATSELNVVLSPELASQIDRVELMDSQGRMVASFVQTPNAIWTIYVSGYSEGQYMLNAYAGNDLLGSLSIQIVR